VVRGAELIGTATYNCLAYHDTAALDRITEAPPLFRVPQFAHNAFARVICALTAQQIIIATQFTTLAPSTNAVLQGWGLTVPQSIRPEILACGINSTCLFNVAQTDNFLPFVIGEIVAFEIFALQVANSGWNDDGNLVYDRCLRRAVPCELNCQGYADIIGYAPVNSPYNVGFGPKNRVFGRERRWEPLLETDGFGFFFRQEHITPHIGFTVQPTVIDEIVMVDPPFYNYKLETNLLLERLRNLTTDIDKQRDVVFYDNKLSVRNLIQTEVRIQFNQSYEQEALFISALDATEADSTISVWRNKVHFDLVRPTTVIQRRSGQIIETYSGNRNAPGPVSVAARNYVPFVRTQPHSEYPSGSACLCKGYQEYTDAFTQGEYGGLVSNLEIPCVPPLCDIPGVVRASDMTDLSNRCGESRLDAGLHFTASVPAGRQACGGIGPKGYELATKLKANSPAFLPENGHFPNSPRPVCGDAGGAH